MPEAHAGYAAPTARVPRTLFQHAHVDGNASHPASTNVLTAECFIQIPDNWNGTDKVIVWLLGGENSANTPYDITLDIATCDEAYNIHTQTVLGTLVNIVLNEYECWDVTAILAVVLANLASGDMLWFKISEQYGIVAWCVGVEIQET